MSTNENTPPVPEPNVDPEKLAALPPSIAALPDSHVDKINFLAKRDPNNPLHRRKDVAIGYDGRQIWKKIS